MAGRKRTKNDADVVDAGNVATAAPKKYYILCISESSRLDIAFDSKEEILDIMKTHFEEHNRLVDDPALQFDMSDFEIVEGE